jgi:SAM-dependent methyltransferase
LSDVSTGQTDPGAAWWAGWCCPYCAYPLQPMGAGLRCSSEDRWFASWDGVHRLLPEERRREMQPSIEVLEQARRIARLDEWDAFPRAREALRAGLRAHPWMILQPFAGDARDGVRLAAEGHQVVALDPSVDGVVGLRAAGTTGLERAEADLEALPLEPAHFDGVLCAAALHHAPRLSRTLVELRRVTKRGGLLVAYGSPVFRRRRDGEAMVEAAMARQASRLGFALPREQQPGYLVLPELPGLFAAAGWRLSAVEWPGWLRELFEDGLGRLLSRGVGRCPLLVARREG